MVSTSEPAKPKKQKILPTLEFEERVWSQGFHFVGGIDEAGRGCWAGPVSAAVVILPHQKMTILKDLDGVRDSKLLSSSRRFELEKTIKFHVSDWAVGFSNALEIDTYGIVSATRLAMQRAISSLNQRPDYLLIDALSLPGEKIPQKAIIKGDMLSLSIAAASILAKTARDRWMQSYEDLLPGFGFACHKGYGTRQHSNAISEKHITFIHRVSYAPIARLIDHKNPT